MSNLLLSTRSVCMPRCTVCCPHIVYQVDLHPFMTRVDIVAMCRKYDIALEVSRQAYSPI